MLCIENDLLSMVVRALCMLLCVLCVLSLGGDGGRHVRDLICPCFSMANSKCHVHVVTLFLFDTGLMIDVCFDVDNILN